MLQKVVVLSTMLAALLAIVACDSGPKIETKAQAFAYAKAYIQTHCPFYIGRRDTYGRPLEMRAGYDDRLKNKVSSASGWYFQIGRGRILDGVETVRFNIRKDGTIWGSFLEGCYPDD